MKSLLISALAAFALTGSVVACDFDVKPAAVHSLYRSSGWSLPGVDDGTLSGPSSLSPMPEKFGGWRGNPASVPGLTLRVIMHDQKSLEPGVLEFPRQEFEQDGKKLVLSRQLMLLEQGWIYRYDREGKPVAYTYGLIPVIAHMAKGEWKIDSEAVCIFYVTFIDDQGDGIFRQLVRGAFSPDLIPRWALDRKKNPA